MRAFFVSTNRIVTKSAAETRGDSVACWRFTAKAQVYALELRDIFIRIFRSGPQLWRSLTSSSPGDLSKSPSCQLSFLHPHIRIWIYLMENGQAPVFNSPLPAAG